ncbi:MAG: TonB-dependent receptor [Ignavibacteria bacterium]|nr:TonB-dependent receptor [Ignavibacteria bacterium]
MKNIVIIILLIFTNQYIFSQTGGKITGRVLDKFLQQPLEGVTVKLKKTDIKTGSDANGFFTLSDISDGTYSVEFSLLGYIPLIIDNVIVSRGRPADIYAQMELSQTEEIVVTAERFVKPMDLTTSVNSLQYEEIRRTPGGFEDIGRVIQTLPGISFVNDGRNDLIVRGGSPAENLFLVDNSYVPNINHFGSQGATGGPVSIINLEFVRDINFLTGGFSSRYGDKLSSVLEINQREGNRNRFMGNINLSATGFGAVFEGPIDKNKNGSYLISARRSYLDIVFNAAGFGFIPEYTSFQLKAVYDISKNNSITANIVGNIDKVRFNNDTQEKIEENENILTNNQWGYVSSIQLKSLLSSKSYSLLNLTRTYTNFFYSGRDINFNEIFKNQSKEGETTLKYEFFYLPSRNTQLEFGAGGKIINFQNEIKSASDTLFTYDPSTGSRYIIPPVSLDDDNNAIKGFAYTQFTYRFFNRLKISFGLRWDYFNFIQTKNYISPRTSLSFLLMQNFSLNLSYGIFYQSPSYLWLISNPSNKNLKNIRADHYVAGLEYIPREDLKITFEAYYKDYSNYPVSELRPYFILANNGGNFLRPQDFPLEPLISAGSGYSRGIEFFLQKSLTERLYGTVNISLFDARYKSLDGTERRSDFDNRYLITINGGYRLGRNWEFSSKIRFYGGRPYTPINPTDGTQDITQYNSARLPDYFAIDIRAEKRWNFSKWTLVTYIDIQNITGRKNITGYEWNKFKNKIEANESIGILPTIGINAMF